MDLCRRTGILDKVSEQARSAALDEARMAADDGIQLVAIATGEAPCGPAGSSAMPQSAAPKAHEWLPLELERASPPAFIVSV